MRIRDLHEPSASNLEIFRQPDGDVVVKIEDASGVHHVTVGMAGSGHPVPPSVKVALAGLVDEFARYGDCKWERDGLNKDYDSI